MNIQWGLITNREVDVTFNGHDRAHGRFGRLFGLPQEDPL